jgi:hypothetical protein
MTPVSAVPPLWFVVTMTLACSGADRDGAGPDAAVPSLTNDSSATNVPTFAPTLSAVYAEVFAEHNCLLGLCHGEGASGGGLTLFPRDRAYGNLLARSGSPQCGSLGLAVVEPGDPSASLLLLKMQADPPCGVQMPPDALVDPRHREQVRDWIARGARDD